MPQFKVVIDCFPQSVERYRDGYAVVAIDVIRATTTAITAAGAGRRCFPVPTLEAAADLALKLENAILAGELRGEMPGGFDLNNSPVDLLLRADSERPIILLSSSGTRLIHAATRCEAAYLACFRNYEFTARYLAGRHERIAVIGAGSRGEFREEDQMCCAWVAEGLLQAGYEPENRPTFEIIRRWINEPPYACTEGKSAAYLLRSGQLQDLDFILAHINDLDAAFSVQNGEVVVCGTAWDAARQEDTGTLWQHAY